MQWTFVFAISAEKYAFNTIYINVTVTNKSFFLEGEPEGYSQRYVHKRRICFLFSGSSLSVLTSLKITVQERKPWITVWRRAQVGHERIFPTQMGTRSSVQSVILPTLRTQGLSFFAPFCTFTSISRRMKSIPFFKRKSCGYNVSLTATAEIFQRRFQWDLGAWLP